MKYAKRRRSLHQRASRFEPLEARIVLDSQIGTVAMPYDGYLSAGVYDSEGHLIRTLFARSYQETGPVPLLWDGQDEYGRTVVETGSYSWRALVSQVEAVDEGHVGDSFFSPSNKFPLVGASSDGGFVEMSEHVRSVAVGPDDSIYLLSRIEEGPGLIKLSKDGQPQWAGFGGGYGSGITVDANYVYTSFYDNNGTVKVQRASAATGAVVPFANPVVVNPGAFEDFESGGGSGGQFWNGNWSLAGSASITNSDVPRGVYHLRLAGNNGVASRQVNLRSGANTHLFFEWKTHNFVAGDSAVVEVHNGSTWQTVFTLTNANGADNYTDANVDLSSFSLPANFQVRFRSLMPNGSGAYVTFDNVSTKFNAIPPNFAYGTLDQERMLVAAYGMAVDAARLYVSNYRLDTIDIYDVSSGSYLGSFSGGASYNPLGIAVGPDGKVYVANSGSKITRYTYSGGTLTAGTDIITGLNDPGAIDFGGASSHLFVGETGTGKIREYQITPTVALAGIGSTFGSLHQSGPISDDAFTFDYGEALQWASIAVDSTGILTVNDIRRVQRFNTAGGTANLYQSWVGQWSGGPTGAYGFHTEQVGPNTHHLHYIMDGSNANLEYEVDADWTGGPRAGWLGDGSWRLVGRYLDVEGSAFRRTVWDAAAQVNREFIFSFSGRQSHGTTGMSVIAYAVTPGGLRRAAIVGAQWLGTSRTEIAQGGQYVWKDADLDGVIDWNGVGSGSSDGEVNWYIPKGQPTELSFSRPWIDEAGNIWLVYPDGNLNKVPLTGFDANGNPQYDWSNKVTVIPHNSELGNLHVRIAPNGDIYALAGAPIPGLGVGIGGIGNYVAHYDPSGNLISAAPTPGSNIMALAYLDEADDDPDYYFAAGGIADQQPIYMYSDDGLLVSKNTFGKAGGYTGAWTDNLYGLTAFQDPNSGKVYSYAQDVFVGRDERYRYDNMDTIQRQGGDFVWSTPAVAAGYWTFDGNLTDAAKTNNGTFSGGVSPTYAAGKIANAIDLDGVNDYVEILDTARFSAYTMSAWVQPTDVTSVNILSRNNGSGVLQQIRINSSSKLEHYTSDGTGHTVTSSTTIAPNTWYHVAIVASNDGMARLYVDGVEQGTAVSIDTLGTGSGGWYVGNTASGFGFFDGLVDDLQIHHAALSSSQISAIYNAGNPSSLPIVKASISDAVVTEAAGNPGAFLITRTGSTTSALTVNYLLTGSAANGVDYSLLSGSVTIPIGSTSTTLTITPLDDNVSDVAETVKLILAYSSSYSAVAGSQTLVITDNDVADFSSDPGWADLDNDISGNSYGYSPGTTNAGGAAGEIGGTFARDDSKSYYADTDLKRAYSFDDVIKASGKFTVFNAASANGEWFVGHMSADLDNNAMMGIQFYELDAGNVRWRIRIGHPAYKSGLESSIDTLPVGDYNFEYSYDPTGGVDKQGQFTVRIYNSSGYDHTLVKDLESHRFVPASFDAFGLGIHGELPDPNSGNTVQFFVDDVNYTGKKSPAGLPIVSISATDSIATEKPLNTGTFTVYRTSTVGNLTVNYTLGVLATNGTDYSSLSGSVVIPNGSVFATITVTPIDDIGIENGEAVILTLSSSANYTIGAPNSSAVSIIDDLVTVSASDPNAGESASNVGVFTITRLSTTGNMLVNFNLSGTAINGTDYSLLSSSVTIANGQSTALVTVTPVDDVSPEENESVTLTLALNGNYLIGGAGNATVVIVDNEGSSDPGWTGSNNTTDGNNFGWSPSTNEAGGITGEIGGTFARTTTDTFYGDTHLLQTYTLNNTFGASGKLDVLNITPEWGDINSTSGLFIGHFSTNVANREFIGLEFKEAGSTAGMLVRARYQRPGTTGAESSWVSLSTNGNHTFSYTYDPNIGSGRLFLSIDGGATLTAVLDSTDRASGAAFDAFGMGMTSNLNSENAPTKTAQVYIDDVTYTGFQAPAAPVGLGFTTNPGFSGSNRTSLGNNFGWNAASSQAGGTTGEIGGTLARATSDAYFGDTFLSQSYSLNNTITGSGKFDLLNITSGWAGSGNSGLFMGHFSTSAAIREFLGIELKNDGGGLTTQMQARARLQLPGGAGTALSSWVNVSTNGNHTFSYTYNPSLGTNGRLTLQIDAQSPLVVDLSAADRSSGSVFNGFGLGYTSNLNSENAPAKTAQAFLDDLQYSGYQPGVSVAATDSSAAEQGLNPGVFTITRTNTDGNLVVNYLLTGKATSGSDYAALPSSVTILNGSTSATITVTPVNDSTAEGDESVVLSLISGSGYHLSTPYNATVKIADNDLFAMDNFENGNGAGGLGWNGAWTLGGTATVTSSGSPNTGSFHLQLTGNGASATRAVSLAGAASARVVLDWKASSFETGETAVVEVFDGTNWLNLLTILDTQDDNVYHHADLVVPAAARNASFQLRIRSLMSSADDLLYIDDVQIAL